ncbi:MAG: glutamate mutase L [Deltaproteobacteria bacterium]|uniref:Glutamate mutase L n=1 Tax=Candidatus Zymogenus saltonus TaxID=2844893 RepID=A0A9D8KGK2_9DELT|nr:glutamate mutase L [Candidatus Zymogenus saltonus]
MRRADLLVAEIGSTITKLSAFDLKGGGGDSPAPFLGQGVSLTTVDEGDVTVGLTRAMEDLKSRLGIETEGANLMAASSAAGGLKMTVHGLTRDMTLRAASEASLGAGAVVVYTTVGEIRDEDIAEIERVSPRLILLAGGVDYGERDVIVKNARILSAIGLNIPIIYAGNVSAKGEIERIFGESRLRLLTCDNVYPRIDELNLKPVKEIIQRAFSDHIINAPGMERVKEMVQGDVMPTPGAVMAASELLYDEIGDLMVVDVGGATTDVHSVTSGSPKLTRLMTAPEPLAKRTVEGDLGVFHNAQNILKQSQMSTAEWGGGAVDAAEGGIDGLAPIPTDEEEVKRTSLLCKWAVDLAVWRHAGEIKVAYGTFGRSELVEGRDLTAVKSIIGTGGALCRLDGGRDILKSIRRDIRDKKLLPPGDAEVSIDSNYIMAAAGVMVKKHPECALSSLKMSLGLDQKGA